MLPGDALSSSWLLASIREDTAAVVVVAVVVPVAFELKFFKEVRDCLTVPIFDSEFPLLRSGSLVTCMTGTWRDKLPLEELTASLGVPTKGLGIVWDGRILTTWELEWVEVSVGMEERVG